MLLSRTKTSNRAWNFNQRQRVGGTVTHNGSDWVNRTGINSEPTDVSSDWVSLSAGVSVVTPPFLVFGNPFTLRKSSANNDPTMVNNLQPGDFALNGENIDSTEFWTSAQYVGTNPTIDKDLPASWKPLFRSRI